MRKAFELHRAFLQYFTGWVPSLRDRLYLALVWAQSREESTRSVAVLSQTHTILVHHMYA